MKPNKRAITLVSALAITALGAFGTSASADAPTYTGTCTITGVSTFSPNLTGQTQDITYNFNSGSPDGGKTADQTTCSGTLNGQQINNVPVKASVSGMGHLSCSNGSNDAPGSGELVFPDGSTFKFQFTFSAFLTEVFFNVIGDNGGGTASGHASFAQYAPPTTPADCAGNGISQLGFSATTNAPDKPFIGTRSTSTSTGSNGGGSTSHKTTKKHHVSPRAACQKKAAKIKNKKKRAAAMKKCKRLSNK
jgi:hypothetical protein